MRTRRWTRMRYAVMAAGVALAFSLHPGSDVVLAADGRPHAELEQQATWKAPAFAEVRQQAVEWWSTREIEPATRTQLETGWESAASAMGDGNLLNLVATTLATVDPRAGELLKQCSAPRVPGPLVDVAWLEAADVAPWERANLRLLYGRWLVQEALYDEANDILRDLKTNDVVDPASLLFYQAVVQQRMLERDAALKTISKLLENEATIPRRFKSLAHLMRADLEPLKDESLDHIARRMDDIRRRLDLGRAGPKVREVEDGVIASLDKLIDEMEKQQQAAAAAAAKAGGGGGGNIRPNQPAPDSVPIGGKGPGDVVKKPVGDQSGWGDLPPRARQEALQQIGQEFPAHYRDMIEQYFRKLANEGEEKAER